MTTASSSSPLLLLRPVLLRVAVLAGCLGLASAGGSVFAQNPFKWDTVHAFGG